MTKAFILEILTTIIHYNRPEMIKKPEIFEFFQNLNLKKKKF